MRRLKKYVARWLKGSSLLEAIVAAVIFLTVFAAVLEIMPRLAVRDDDALLVAEAEYRVSRTFEKYATGEWPCGEYSEQHAWGEIRIRIALYRDLDEVQIVAVAARIDGSRKQITHTQLIECVQ